MIKINNLTKKYKEKYAVNNLNLEIKSGELFSLLGTNGAGKTTTIKMLSTLILPTSGEVKINNFDLTKDSAKIKEIINISPQETAIAPNLTVIENLYFMAGIYQITNKEEKINELVKIFKLDDVLKQKAKTLSGGYQRKLSIAISLINSPKILFLDEPTLGLDVISRHDLWNIIESLKGNTTIILTTHYMEEVEHIADRILVIDKGKQIAGGTLKELLQSYENRVIYFLELDGLHKNRLNEFDFLNNINGIQKVQIYKEMLKVTAQKNISLSELFSALSTHGYTIKNMSSETGSLETVFLELTGRNLRD